ANGTFVCKVGFAPGAQQGTWTLVWVSLYDAAGNSALVQTPELQAAGYPTTLQVTNPDEDIAPPTLSGVSYASTVKVTEALSVTITASDAGLGVDRVGPVFRNPSGTQYASCTANTPASGTRASGTWVCSVTFAPGAETGTWTLEWVALFDRAENNRDVTKAELEAAGYPTTLTVTP
ncbi:MAG TPA: hypothetical protein VGB66_08270, partial [Longimicrobium sp.]